MIGTRIKAKTYVNQLATAWNIDFGRLWASIQRQTGYDDGKYIDSGGDTATDIYALAVYFRAHQEDALISVFP